jgi:Cu/Ag efflux pump CusA
MTVQKQPNASTIDLTRAIDRELKELEKSLPEGVQLETDLFKQSHFIESSIKNVEEALRDGIFMVMIILFLFLMNFRTTSITLVAIPLSLIIKTKVTFYIH